MIKDKRDSLEKFIREQLIGPGGCANKFGVIPSQEEQEESVCEVLSTTPGSIYSSAILFPRKDDNKAQEDTTFDPNDSENADDENISDEDSDEQGDDMRDLGNHEDDEDINSLSRRFPDRIGISCCVKELDSLNTSTKITISGRYYTKLKEKTRLYVNIEDVEFFDFAYSMEKSKELFSQSFVYSDAKLRLSHTITKAAEVADFREKLRDLNKYFCSLVAKNENGEYDEVYTEQSFQDKNKFLSAYKERLYKSLKKIDKDGNYITAAKVGEYKDRIAKVEQF